MARNDIQPNLQTMKEYFSRKELYIPSYQRPYAWQVAQCEQLVEDIENHKENFDEEVQDNYFFGAVLIAQDSNEKHEIALIDGQQRTTTFMLLLKALLMKINEELEKLSDDSLDDQMLIEKLTDLKADIISMLYNLDEKALFAYKRKQYELKFNNLKYVNESISEQYAEDMDNVLLADNFEKVEGSVINIPRRQKDNKYTNFYKNFRYFYSYAKKLTNTQVRDFTNHFIEYCQVITITSYNTDQAINIFNSLNGTGLPLTAIEVIVSQTTAKAKERKVFESNWQGIVEKVEHSPLDLNSLMTHYIFTKLSEKNGSEKRNPGIRNFFKKNKEFLKNDVKFTDDLKKILDNFIDFSNTELGKIFEKFNGNLKPFVSSYLFFRVSATEAYLKQLLKLGVLIELSELSYSHKRFKGFLEDLNVKYSQVEIVSEETLIQEIHNHIAEKFSQTDVEQTLKESGVPNSIIYLNEYLYALESGSRFSLGGTVDIEHIMPQSGVNRENIWEDAGFTSSEEFYEYAEKLGNKILLEANINRGIGDAWFRTKKVNSITTGNGYVGSQYPLAQALANYPKDTWSKEDIELATDKAAKRIVRFIFE
ncbi:DUF262 domain-containing protein [Lysinibacillus xylanilyticus]|uniref:DUF262 domain-containing protein n=1 Tax=Lysinibacillus xylanilyticus TaxID=582475 RepID=UPI003829DB62